MDSVPVLTVALLMEAQVQQDAAIQNIEALRRIIRRGRRRMPEGGSLEKMEVKREASEDFNVDGSDESNLYHPSAGELVLIKKEEPLDFEIDNEHPELREMCNKNKMVLQENEEDFDPLAVNEFDVQTMQQQKKKNVMADHLDTELLIAEVKKRPVLWDSTTGEYNDKNKKMEAWTEVCRTLVKNFDEKSSVKENIGKVQERWRNIQDAYTQDYRKYKRKSKSESKSVKYHRYIFAEQLSFLRKVMENKTSTNSLSSGQDSGEECEETSQDCTIVHEISGTFPGSSENRKSISLEDKMIKFMEDHQREQQSEDADKNFFMSMLPSVRTLDENKKMEFRLQVMQALQSIKAGQYKAHSISE